MSQSPPNTQSRQRVPRDPEQREFLRQKPLRDAEDIVRVAARFNLLSSVARDGRLTLAETRNELRQLSYYDINKDGEIDLNDDYNKTTRSYVENGESWEQVESRIDEEDYDAFHAEQDVVISDEDEARRQRLQELNTRRDDAESAVTIRTLFSKNPYALGEDEDLAESGAGRFSIPQSPDARDKNVFISSRRPEIISKIPLFLFKDSLSLSNLHELRQFEKHLAVESLDKNWQEANTLLDPAVVTQISTLKSRYDIKNTQQHDALCNLRSTIDLICGQIDLRNNSPSVAQFAKNYASQLLDPREGDFSTGPESIEKFLETYCGYRYASNFSSTKLFYLLIREFSNAIRRHSPLLLSNSTRQDSTDTKPFKIDAYSPESLATHELTVHALGTRNIANIVFSDGTTSAGIENRRCVTRSYRNAMPGIVGIQDYADRVRVLSTVLHNELSVSSGIGLLAGTPAGNAFGVTGEDPVANILGGYFTEAFSAISGRGRPNSYADLVVLNENFSGAPSARVLPFESNVVIAENNEILTPGSHFFIESPIAQGSLETPLPAFAKKILDTNSAGQVSLKSLLSFDGECKFTPSDIVVGCLKIIANESKKLLIPEIDFSEVLPLIMMSQNWSLNRGGFTETPVFAGSTPGVTDLLFSSCAFRRSETNIADDADKSFIPTFSYPASFSGRRISAEERLQLSLEDLKFRSPATTSRTDAEIAAERDSFDSSVNDHKRKIDTFINGSLFYFFSTSYPLVSRSPPKITSFEGSTILDAIREVLRDIQRKVRARSSGPASSFLDSDGLTRFNRWDDNTMLACIFEITRCLVLQLIDIKREDILKSDADYLSFQLRLTGNSRDNIERAIRFIETVVSTYEQSGNVRDIFDLEGNARSVLGVGQNDRFKFPGMTAGKIVEIINDVIEHRKFLKISLGFLDAITSNITSANDRFGAFLSSTQGSTNFTNVFNDIKASPAGLRSVESLTLEQNSLRQFQLKRDEVSSRPSGISVSSFSTAQEDEILEFFIEEVGKFTGENNVALCVGLPSGFLKNLRSKTQNESDRTGLARDTQQLLNINFHRANELTQGSDPGNTDINTQGLLRGGSFQPTQISIKFDPEIFILPGDLRFSNSEVTGAQIVSLISIVEGTIFTRIKNGKIINASAGKSILATTPALFNILKNHVTDRLFKLFARNIFGVNLDDDQWLEKSGLLGCVIDDDTYLILQKMLSNGDVAASLGIDFDTVKKYFKPSPVDKIYSPVELNNRNVLPANSVDKIIKVLSNKKLNTHLTNQKALCPKLFDRVFIVAFSSEQYSPLTRSNAKSFLISFNETRSAEASSFSIDGFICNADLTAS